MLKAATAESCGFLRLSSLIFLIIQIHDIYVFKCILMVAWELAINRDCLPFHDISTIALVPLFQSIWTNPRLRLMGNPLELVCLSLGQHKKIAWNKRACLIGLFSPLSLY